VNGVAVVLAGFAIVALLLAWSRWLARRRVAATGHVLLAILAGWGALAVWSVIGGLDSYAPAPGDQPIAELYLEQTGAQRYRGTLTRLPAGRVQVFELAGDQWRLEARTLEWQGLAAELGLEPMYRLERLLTRARPAPPGEPAATSAPASRFELAAGAGEDLWAKARTRPSWERHLRGGHADSSWHVLVDKARFTVWLTGPALRVEAANQPAASPPPG
jgi:hypothetical protein